MPRLADVVRIAGKALRVGATVLCERAAPRNVHHADDVPGSVARITPEWLTAVLCSRAAGARVLDFAVTGGDSGSSTRRGLALELNDVARQADVPERLFSKTAPTFVQRMFLGLSGAAHGESGFYSYVRPRLQIEAPLGYHAGVDTRSWRSITLMEDVVVTKGARFISTETYIDREMMADLLANIAGWHAQFWGSPKLHKELSWIRTTSQFLSDTERFVSLRDRALIAIEKYPHLVPDDIRHLGHQLWAATTASFEINRRMPQTFLHGDAHIGQAYITSTGKMGYSDWQLIQRGGWAADFAYAITSALTVEDRRRWDRELLQHYLDALADASGPRLNFNDAWLAYRQHTLYPFFAWAFTRAGASALLPDMQPDYVCNDIMARTAHAVSDLEALAAVNSH